MNFVALCPFGYHYYWQSGQSVSLHSAKELKGVKAFSASGSSNPFGKVVVTTKLRKGK